MTPTHRSSPYRTHTCNQLNVDHVDQTVTLSGWVHRKRDHGGLIFIDLRDHFGITQCIISQDTQGFDVVEKTTLESVITVHGVVVKRAPETINTTMDTGHIEIDARTITVLSMADIIPFSINTYDDKNEDLRLKYRFLDLRRPDMHQAIVMRSAIISFIRKEMESRGFLDIQTPILSAPSPEGARDYVVPSRLHKGLFYALPQAPQQFKQLLMASGFDRYFQIAPCFRDEDSRADRSPGEFYQLDMEMAFVTQEDVWSVLEPVMINTFKKFASCPDKVSTDFPRIPYDQALVHFGSDKPDLRNPLRIEDMTHSMSISIFNDAIANGSVLRGLVVPGIAEKPGSFFKTLDAWAKDMGSKGLGYITHKNQELKGPLVKFCSPDTLDTIKTMVPDQGVIFFVCDEPKMATSFSGQLRTHLGNLLCLVDEKAFAFCWVVDFPMYEKNDQTGCIEFSHNPFSMPQGGYEALDQADPLDIKAFQYDLVCNGVELCSGAIRNHEPRTMEKAFAIAGHSKDDLYRRFGALIKAFNHGTPPHGGAAPGIDRMVMLLAGTPNIREVIAFPMNQKARDLMMDAPCTIESTHLKELGLSIVQAKKFDDNDN